MSAIEVFKEVPPSVANIDNPVTYTLFQNVDTPADDQSAIYLHTILFSKERLTVLCCYHAGMYVLTIYPCIPHLKFEPKTDLSRHILRQFYALFSDAFVNPEHMSDKAGVTLKQAIIDNFAKYNASLKVSHKVPLFLGDAGLMALAWNPETITLTFPTLEKLLSSPPIIPESYIIETLTVLCKECSAPSESRETDCEQID
jgi:hypothetical protein